MSAWNASACRSNISSMYSLKVSGTTGCSGTEKSLLVDSALTMRCSTSRTASKDWPSFERSPAPSRLAKRRDLLCQRVEDAAIALAPGAPRSRRRRTSARTRSADWFPTAAGSSAVFHDIEFYVGAGNPWSQAPTTSLRSTETSSDGSFVSRQYPVGDHLIDRRPRLHVGAFRLLRVRAAHEGRCGTVDAVRLRRPGPWPGSCRARKRTTSRSRNGSSGVKLGDIAKPTPSVEGVQSNMLAPFPQ